MYRLLLTQFIFLIHFLFATSQTGFIRIDQNSLDTISTIYNTDPYILKSTCFKYFFLIEQNVLFKKYKNQIALLPKQAEIAYKLGDINELEKEEINLHFHDIENTINNISYDISIIENQIRLLLDTTLAIIPVSDTLYRYMSFNLAAFLNYQKNNISTQNLNTYIDQENKLLRYYQLRDEYNFYKNHKLPYLNMVELQAKYKLKQEVINFAEYANLLKNILEVRNDFLIQLNKLNQHAIEIDKITYNN